MCVAWLLSYGRTNKVNYRGAPSLKMNQDTTAIRTTVKRNE